MENKTLDPKPTPSDAEIAQQWADVLAAVTGSVSCTYDDGRGNVAVSRPNPKRDE
jgi:hypothetical protein